MKKLHTTLKALAFAIAAACGIASAYAEGDIFEIRPSNSAGAIDTSYSGKTLDTGDDVYFRVRMANRYDATTSSYKPWYLKPTVGVMTNQVQIGIFASGEIAYADLERNGVKNEVQYPSGSAGEYFTDFIFHYKVAAGDYASPIVFAASTNDPFTAGSSMSAVYSYVLVTNGVEIVNDNGDRAEWYIPSPDRWSTDVYRTLNNENKKETSDNRTTDYSLSDAGFVVKTVTVDSNWSKTDGIWRDFYKSDEGVAAEIKDPEGIRPQLSLTKTTVSASRNKTLYVWTTNDAVRVHGATAVDMLVPEADGTRPASTTPVYRKAVELTSGAVLSEQFDFEGRSSATNVVDLFVSAWDGYRYDSAAAVLDGDFFTVKVRCRGTKPKSVEIDVPAAYTNLVAAAETVQSEYSQIKVSLTQTNSVPVTLTLVPEVNTLAGRPWQDYIYITDVPTYPDATLTNSANPEVTFELSDMEAAPEGEGPSKTLYVFARNADGYTHGSYKVNFSLNESTGSFDASDTASLYVTPATPVITEPLDMRKIEATAKMPESFPLTITGGTFLDVQSETGFKLMLQYRDGYDGEMADPIYVFRQVDGTYLDKDGKQPTYTYPSRYAGQTITNVVWVVAPESRTESEKIRLEVTVLEKEEASIHFYTDSTLSTEVPSDSEVAEGSSVIVQVDMGDTADNDLYAFLFTTGVSKEKFGEAARKFIVCDDTVIADDDTNETSGLRIPGGKNLSQTAKLEFLDGWDASISFGIYIGTNRQYTAGSAIDTVSMLDGSSITVTNVAAAITRIDMGTSKIAAGSAIALTRGDERTFRGLVTDAGGYDLANTVTTDPAAAGDRMRARWDVYIGGASSPDTVKSATIYGNPNEDANRFTCLFDEAGEWRIVLNVGDKDTSESDAVQYEFTVNVTDPTVVLGDFPTYGTSFYEDDASSKLKVSLNAFDAAFTGTVYVAVAVKGTEGAMEFSGKLTGTDDEIAAALNADVSAIDTATTDYYLIPFTSRNYTGTSATTLSLVGTTLDGAGAEFDINAWVAFTVDGGVTNSPLPTYGVPATSYYTSTSAAGTGKAVTLMNRAPSMTTSIDGAGTNAIETVSTVTVTIPSRSDVPADMAAGLTLTFGGSVVNGYSTNITSGASLRFHPDFGSGTGSQFLTITLVDKDGGAADSRTIYYYFQTAKFLRTAANGPGGDSAIPLSVKYAGQTGVGEGHMYVSDGSFASAEDFTITWNMGTEAKEATIYGYGFNAYTTYSDGLNAAGVKGLDPLGNRASADTVPASFYTFDEPRNHDSFYYGLITATEPGGEEYKVTVAPQVGTNRASKSTIKLPTAKTEDEVGYLNTYAEAIFSKEYDDRDNLGDIDQDGIPDYFAAVKTYYNGALLATPDGAGGELGARGGMNDDEDFLPSTSQMGKSSIVPGSASSWETSGTAFTAMREIRGLHDGLNYGMFRVDATELKDYTKNGWISDLELSDNEKRSLLRHVFQRRDYLYNKILRGEPFVIHYPDNEETEWTLVTNLLGSVFAAGCNMYTLGDTRFVSENQTEDNYFEVEVTNTVAGVDVVSTNLCWERVYWSAGASEEEKIHVTNVVKVTVITNVAEEVVTVTNTPAMTLAFTDINIGDWLAEEVPPDQQVHAKAYIDYTWRHYTSSDIWGWTCENRTDPTIDDTDHDGMPDGYEYFFWYDAVIGVDGTNTLRGCKFDLGDVESRANIISSEEIANIYNPNKNRHWNRQDTDEDGLYDLEEFLIGTSPVDWDTDRDGLSDLFEVIYGMNPLTTTPGNNAVMNADGDSMAYVDFEDVVDGFGHNVYVYQAKNGNFYALTNNFELGDAETNETTLISGGVGFRVVPFGYENNASVTNFIPATERFSADLAYLDIPDFEAVNARPVATNKVTLVHSQVYSAFGFDPRTAWGVTGAGNGSLSQTQRWFDHGAILSAGKPKRTKQYFAIDEFRSLKWRYLMGWRSLAKDKADIKSGANTLANIMLDGTTNPNVIREGATVGDSETVYGNITRHGADTDGDGVPDGWELYVGVSPNNDFTIPKGSPGYDKLYWDGGAFPYIGNNKAYDDGLNLAGEFAGNDSCAWHEACESIYANHPSQSESAITGWFNKFFPTDPRDSDTDGDGINDGAEGAGWTSFLTLNRWSQTKLVDEAGVQVKVNHKFIYGSPRDKPARCIKGGGMNPCSIDTDEDGLPDPWEKQYAGLVCVEGQVESGVFKNGEIDSEIYDDVRAAIVAYGYAAVTAEVDSVSGDVDTNIVNGTYFICMGQDATVADAVTDPTTIHDLDWDGDGLQNWQEYMVQAIRHFRYDDDKTPLMGRDIPAFDLFSADYVEGQWNGATDGYMAIDLVNPMTNSFVTAALASDYGYPHFAAFLEQCAASGENYLRTLGYFAPPPKSWDVNRCDYDRYYMLPPSASYIDADNVIVQEQATTFVSVDGQMVEVPLWEYCDPETGEGIGEICEASAHDYLWVHTNIVTQTAVDGTHYFYDDPDDGMDYLYSVTPALTDVLKPNFRTSHATGYVSCDPRLWDTDMDGMDDYWELYHGLNPIFGYEGTQQEFSAVVDGVQTNYFYVSNARDVIADAYFDVTAWRNGWIGWQNTERPVYDPIKYPWMIGASDCDADGDGIRNQEEAILANVTEPNASHTDPSALWMTDTTVAAEEKPVIGTEEIFLGYNRITKEPITKEVATTNSWLTFYKSPSYTALYYPLQYTEFGSGYAFSFEENEGYDTDNDFRSDANEMTGRVEPTSDPQSFADPARRQSIWFGGPEDRGAAVTFESSTRPVAGDDFFKTFTVEAWVKPEATGCGSEQYIVTRAANYGAWDLNHTSFVVRVNFALGLNEAGQPFAEFENSTDSKLRINDKVALLDNVWTHLAATFDGETLILYINGQKAAYDTTDLIPANGISETLQDAQSIVDFPYAGYMYRPCCTMLGAKPAGEAAFSIAGIAEAADWDEIAERFFEGSVAEVRIWDGARTLNQIADNYRKKFTVKEIEQLRTESFQAYANGARRNTVASGGDETLPAELIQNYSFETLPGAVEADQVAQEPAGFSSKTLTVLKNPETGDSLTEQAKVGWWNSILTNEVLAVNQVYKNPYNVPWIENTITHLPRMSGLVDDSIFWSANFAGYTPASFHDLAEFDFPRSMNPYGFGHKLAEDTYALQKYRKLAAMSDSWAYLRAMVRYEDRFTGNGISDLVPLGSAFAKRNAKYWDGQGAETAWGATGVDSDGDELPDWWEEYAASEYGVTGDIDSETLVIRNGQKMTAGEAYFRDIAAGLLPTKTVEAAYFNREDQDKDGLPDWWSKFYGIKNGAMGDDDNDGLSNYTEYLLSEVFNLGVTFSPVKANSVSDYDTDYFFKIGQLYAGEIFTDHDFMEDVWEDEQGVSYASRYVWDSHLDKDEDGWTAFSECRYNQFTAGILAPNISHVLGNEEFKDVPIPTLKLTLRYNGSQPLVSGGTEGSSSSSSSDSGETDANTLAPLVVQTFTRDGLVVPDATFQVSPGAIVQNYKYIGMWADRTVRGTLAPGYVDPNSVDIQFMSVNKNDTYVWRMWNEDVTSSYIDMGTYEEYMAAKNAYGMYGTQYSSRATGTTSYGRVELMSSPSEWESFRDNGTITVTTDDTTENGYICYHGERVGTINTITGEYSLDLGIFAKGGMVSTNGTAMAYSSSSIRMVYTATLPKLSSNMLEINLGEATTGYVKEGKNTIVAFYDLDNSGNYTPGEPMGVAADVDVGWYQAAAEIELTDTTPIITRLRISEDPTSDRKELYGKDDGDTTLLIEGELSGGKYQRVRVLRTLIDGWGVEQLNTPDAIAGGRLIVDKYIELDQRNYLFEGDVLENGEFDIDWSRFQSEVMANSNVGSGQGRLNVTSVTYRVVLGSGDISVGGTNNLYTIATVRHFEHTSERTRAYAMAPGSQQSAVYEARPVFKWTMKKLNGLGREVDEDSYTAFSIQVFDMTTNLVWDSGIRRAPARDLKGVYTFKPDVYAGDGRLEPDQNYSWRVSMYNSKFQDPLWSTNTVYFRMNALTNSTVYGSIKVAAKYFGPDDVLDNGTVRLEAFTSPDFSGDPVSRAYVTDKSTVSATNTEHVLNATLVGLPKGTYYVRGYIDMSGYGSDYAKDAWESWGYACPRSGTSADMFMPSAIVVSDQVGESDLVDVYIEDVDTNGNNLPDAWEVVQNGGTLDNGTERIDDTLDTGIIINKDITDNLQDLEGTSTVAGLASYIFSVVKNSGVAALALDADMASHRSYTLAAATAVGAITTSAEADSVEITGITAEDSKVTVSFRGKATGTATGTSGSSRTPTIAARVYKTSAASSDTGKLIGRVQYKKSLSDPEWTDSDITVAIDVAEGDNSFSFDLDVSDICEGDEECFFRIEVLD